MPSKSIFISHAAADSAIADIVVDILNTGMGIDVQKEVFCTSLEGLKIPPGKDFKEFVRDQIQTPKIVMLLISENYLASQFCLAEVGASWAMAHRVIPMLVPPSTYADMKAVLANVQALKIDDPSDWNEALQVFKDELEIDPKVNRWERKRDELLKRLETPLRSQPSAPIVSAEKFGEIRSKLDEANDEIIGLEAQLTQQVNLNDFLKELKDANEVARVELDNLPSSEALKSLCDAVSDLFSELPEIVQEALYYRHRRKNLPWPPSGYSDTDDKIEEIRRSEEAGYLVNLEEEGVGVDEGNPIVEAAISALKAVESFMESNDELDAPYVSENGHQFSMRIRQFWDTNF